MQLRRFLALAAVLGLGLTAQSALAEQIWTVRSGHTSIHFNLDRMHGLGLSIARVDETANVEPGTINMERPNWHFALSPDTDLTFRTESGVFHPGGFVEGALRHDGGFSIELEETGVRADVSGFAFEYNPYTAESPSHDFINLFDVRDLAGPTPLVTDLAGTKIRFVPDAERVEIAYVELRLSDAWASQVGRPELGGELVGHAHVAADVEFAGGAIDDGLPAASNRGDGIRDVALGILSNISYWTREGTYPNGVNGLSMATTSCNFGDVDVEWEAAMQEDHPVISMHLYRYMDGALEMLGASGVKHGWFALSSSQCTPCENPSDGTYLGVGCSDTYSSSNNADRFWLAPREEIEPFGGTWECTASHFAGGQPNCSRNHSSGGHSPTEHRLPVADADLDLPDATYLYEGYYVVRDDDVKSNNVGSRYCTMEWEGSSWDFDTTPGSNPLVWGPAITRWAELDPDLEESDITTTWANVAPDDGQVVVATTATDIGGGMWHYEYAVYNFDSDNQVNAVKIPLGSAAHSLANIGFHDPDLDETNEWSFNLLGNLLVFETDEFASPDANPVGWGELFNFRFDCAVPPVDGNINLSGWKNDSDFAVASIHPETSASAPDVADRTGLQFRNSPNPMSRTTSIEFELAQTTDVRVEIFDANGRLVRELVDGDLAAGPHAVQWDGTNGTHDRVASGMYYSRLRAGEHVGVQSIMVVN